MIKFQELIQSLQLDLGIAKIGERPPGLTQGVVFFLKKLVAQTAAHQAQRGSQLFDALARGMDRLILSGSRGRREIADGFPQLGSDDPPHAWPGRFLAFEGIAHPRVISCNRKRFTIGARLLCAGENAQRRTLRENEQEETEKTEGEEGPLNTRNRAKKRALFYLFLRVGAL